MNGILRRIAAGLSVLAVMAAVDLPKSVPAAAESAHTDHKVCVNADACPDCAHTEIVWNEWTSTNALPTAAGNYYLGGDVRVSAKTTINANVALCLNGHSITMTAQKTNILEIVDGGSLSLCDCGDEQGKLTHSNGYKVSGLGVSVTGGNFEMYSGVISDNNDSSSYCSGGVEVSAGVFTMNGGRISNNNANTNGGGVSLSGYKAGGTFIMNGGEISGNHGSGGGGVYASKGTFIMNGGTISGNTAAGAGAGVYANGATVVMNGGKISDNTASNRKNIGKGGGVYINYGTFTVNGGEITGNTALADEDDPDTGFGGGVYVEGNGTFELKSGTISGNTAEYAGGGVFVYDNGTFTVNGAVNISGNTARSANSNVCLSGGIVTVGSAFSTASKIGVSSATAPTCESPAAVTNETSEETCGKFTSEQSDSEVTLVYGSDGVIRLEKPHAYAAWSEDEDYHWRVCGDCSAEEEKAAHEWDDGEVVKAPTCTETGLIENKECSVCGKVLAGQETVPALGHTEAVDAAVLASCTEAGKTAGSHCSVCDTVLTEPETVPALGHTWDEGTVMTEPTERVEGVRTYACAVCGAVKTEPIPALGGADDPETPDEPEIGSITAAVEPGENVPATALKTPEEELIGAVLTPEEREQSGVNIKIVLKVEDGTATVPAEDRESVGKALDGLSGYRLGQYLEIELLKIIGGTREKISETNAAITVTFEIPTDLRGKAGYCVIRVHDGETAVLPDLDGDRDTVTIATDKFSTYALVYAESDDSGENPAIPSVPGNPGSRPGYIPGGTGSAVNPGTSGGSDGPSTVDPDKTEDDREPEISGDGNGSDVSEEAEDEEEPDVSDGSENGGETDEGETDSSTAKDPNAGTDPDADTDPSVDTDPSAAGNDSREKDENPSTGAAVSLTPAAIAAAVTAITRRRKKARLSVGS